MLPFIRVLAQGEPQPLWKQILTGIPHDASAFVAYALVALFGAAIWIGSRKRSE